MSKIFSIFQRDLKIALKDPMALWIGLVPIFLAILIVALTPTILSTSVNLAIYDSGDGSFTEQMKDYAVVETFDNLKALEERVQRRDEFIGIINDGTKNEMVLQGNESEQSLKLSKALIALYKMDRLKDASSFDNVQFIDFQNTTSPLKRALSASLLLIITILSAMLIALGVVVEKADKTIRAANVTPIKQTTYLLSKSIMGILNLVFCSVVCLIILGLTSINWLQMAVMIFSIGLLGMIIAFAIGLSSTDFIEAAGSLKILMLPLLAGVLVYELLDQSWHFTVMWDPFYWAYKGVTEISTGNADWGSILKYSGIILGICLIVYMGIKRIMQKHLN